MPGVTTERWSRELWDFAGQVTAHRLARLCPLCPDKHGTRMTLDGIGSINVPIHYNAKSFTITVQDGADESVVVWDPCGHTVVVEDRLFKPREDIPPCPA